MMAVLTEASETYARVVESHTTQVAVIRDLVHAYSVEGGCTTEYAAVTTTLAYLKKVFRAPSTWTRLALVRLLLEDILRANRTLYNGVAVPATVEAVVNANGFRITELDFKGRVLDDHSLQFVKNALLCSVATVVLLSPSRFRLVYFAGGSDRPRTLVSCMAMAARIFFTASGGRIVTRPHPRPFSSRTLTHNASTSQT
jgi:hypothetical protein